MDIYKERILPLFQKSGLNDQQLENNIGLPTGILYDWKKGRTKSYKKYCGQIAKYFNVSTDYLNGLTDDPATPGQKEKPPAPGGEPIPKYSLLTPENRAMIDSLIEKLLESQSDV